MAVEGWAVGFTLLHETVPVEAGQRPRQTLNPRWCLWGPDSAPRACLPCPASCHIPACRAPSIASAAATSPTTATVTINPPPTIAAPVASYTLTAVPTGGAQALSVTCTDPTNCQLTGLTPFVTYTLTATATLTDGSTTPASAPAQLTMPNLSAPTLNSAVAIGPTTGIATATPPPSGGPFTQYTFTATLVGGNGTATATCLSASPRCTFTGLAPAKQYAVRVTATTSSGGITPLSNAVVLATPAGRWGMIPHPG